jgi:hypothetical protein
MISTYIWIALLMFFGAWLLYMRKKRKFDRLNEHGIEKFGSYLEKAKANTFDTFLLWAGYLSFSSAVFMLMGISYTTLGWLIFAVLVVIFISRSSYRHK